MQLGAQQPGLKSPTSAGSNGANASLALEQLCLPFAGPTDHVPGLTIADLMKAVSQFQGAEDPRDDLDLVLNTAHAELGFAELRQFEQALGAASFSGLDSGQLKAAIKAARLRAAQRDPTRATSPGGTNLPGIEHVERHCHFIRERLPLVDRVGSEERFEILSLLVRFDGAADLIRQRCSGVRDDGGELRADLQTELNAATATFPRTCEYLRQSLCKHPACFVSSPIEWPARVQKLGKYRFDEMTIINPALAFPPGCALVTQPFVEEKDGGDGEENYPVLVAKLIAADGRILPFSERVSEEPGEIVRIEGTDWVVAGDPPAAPRARWSKEGVQSFLLNTAPRIDPGKLYSDTFDLVSRFSWLEDARETHLVALYILLSYFHPVFPAIPYLHLLGIWGGGKTTLARIIAYLAFNGWHVVQPSGPALFRTIEAEQCTFVIDEKEDISNRRQARDSDLVPILKAGYQRGAQVPRCNTARGNRVDYFSVYSPKVIANIFGLEEVLADRCVGVHCREAPDEALNLLEKKQPDEKDRRFQRLRDQFYLLVMQFHQEVRDTYDACLNQATLGTKLRDNELFLPLAVIARFVETHSRTPIMARGVTVNLTEMLTGLVRQKVEQRAMQKTEAPELILNSVLHELLDAVDKDVEWFHALEIQRAFDMHYSQPQDWATEIWIGKTMKQTIGVIRKPSEAIRKHVFTCPRVTQTRVDPNDKVMTRKRVRFYRVDRRRLRKRAHDDRHVPKKVQRGREEIDEGNAIGGGEYREVLDNVERIRDQLEADYRRSLPDETTTAGDEDVGVG